MSMLNKNGDVFTLLGIQEEKEEILMQKNSNLGAIRPEDLDLFLGRTKGVRSHHSHPDYDSTVQQGQNDD